LTPAQKELVMDDELFELQNDLACIRGIAKDARKNIAKAMICVHDAIDITGVEAPGKRARALAALETAREQILVIIQCHLGSLERAVEERSAAKAVAS
jgi:hypothetical protein